MAIAAEPGGRRRASGVVLLVFAGVTMIVGLGIALTPFDQGDTYCGRVAWDANRGKPCADEMTMRTTASVLLLGGTAMAIGMRFSWRSPGVLLGIAVVVAALGVTRLLEPTDASWCGSVLNRHRTYEPAIESRCDTLLKPHRSQAAVAFGISLVSAGLAAFVARAALLRDEARAGCRCRLVHER